MICVEVLLKPSKTLKTTRTVHFFTMALETIYTAPRVEDFTPLSQHQEQTPGTFFGGNPVLHLHSPGAQIKISPEDLETQSTIASLHDEVPPVGDDGQATLRNVDIWVTSQ
jgi:nucleotide-sensitive chloride channel 1A